MMLITIMRKVRNFLIPHDDNGRVPHIFSEKVSVGLIVFVVLIYGTSLISTLTVRMKDQVGAVYASVLVDMTNVARAETSLPTLSVSPTLTAAATEKVNDMVKNTYFAHTSPDGITPWYWFDSVGYKFSYAGENLAVGFTESEQVQTGWLNSPTHKANIMSANFTEIGIAVADGVHKGKPAVYVVQMFGKPKKQVPQLAIINTAEAITKPAVEETKNVLSATAGEAQALVTTFEDKYLAIVRNETPEMILEDAVVNDISNENQNIDKAPLSTTQERMLVSQPLLVQYVFTIIMLLTLFSLIIFLFLEFKSKHMKHAIYGVILLAVTAGLSVANQAMIVVPELFY
jgi:hypothetical protein